MTENHQATSNTSGASDWSVSAGIGVISLALMHAQIVLTRIFSVIVWYHFAFFAISVAVLGLTASALLVGYAGYYLCRGAAAGRPGPSLLRPAAPPSSVA